MTDTEPKTERPRFRPPRMTTDQRDAIAEPVKGWLLRDKDTGQVEMFDGTKWVPAPEFNSAREEKDRTMNNGTIVFLSAVVGGGVYMGNNVGYGISTAVLTFMFIYTHGLGRRGSN